ncbi:DUF5011 domain-containing protein [Verrucomicrobia bacterium]|nr:DUF5011 domain-containing protein [Verrucomicrobiota bacterium]
MDGDLFASGNNDRGQLGGRTFIGGLPQAGVPHAVFHNPTQIEVCVLDVAAGDQHTLIVKGGGSNSEAYSAGANWQHQLGYGTTGTERAFLPVKMQHGLSVVGNNAARNCHKVEQVVAGNNHSLFLRETFSLNVMPQVISQLPGTRFELQAPMAGGAGVELQWFKDGIPLFDEILNLETGDVLVRDPLSPADAGEYKIYIGVGSTCAEILMASLDVSCAQDTTPPVITLIGDSRVQIPLGVPFLDPGAMVTDDLDPSVQYTVQGVVDATREGVYELTYHATDACGNQAIPLTRTVTISALRMIPDAVGGRQGSEVFVPFRVSGFTNMEDLNLSIEWDPGFMELALENGFPKLSYPTGTDIHGMVTPRFEFGSGPLTPGRLRMQWPDSRISGVWLGEGGVDVSAPSDSGVTLNFNAGMRKGAYAVNDNPFLFETGRTYRLSFDVAGLSTPMLVTDAGSGSGLALTVPSDGNYTVDFMADGTELRLSQNNLRRDLSVVISDLSITPMDPIGYSHQDGTVLFAFHFTLVGDVGTSSTIGIDSDPNLFTVEWAMDRSANITTVTQPAGVIILDKGMLDREIRLNEAGPMRSFGFKGGKVRVEFDTQLGETYLLEYSASLGSPEWQLLGTRQGTGRAEVFEVPAGGGSGGFFRMLNR